jgi:hypothetical protein
VAEGLASRVNGVVAVTGKLTMRAGSAATAAR